MLTMADENVEVSPNFLVVVQKAATTASPCFQTAGAAAILSPHGGGMNSYGNATISFPYTLRCPKVYGREYGIVLSYGFRIP